MRAQRHAGDGVASTLRCRFPPRVMPGVRPHTLMLKYCAAAGALGIGWFVVLLLPAVTREWLLADTFQNLGCLVVASVIVALMCRKFIRNADTFGDHLVRATVVPYLGCFMYLSLWAGLLWIRSFVYGGLANLHDTLSLYVMGLTATAVSFFVVIPYGLLCQYVMKSVSNADGGITSC